MLYQHVIVMAFLKLHFLNVKTWSSKAEVKDKHENVCHDNKHVNKHNYILDIHVVMATKQNVRRVIAPCIC